MNIRRLSWLLVGALAIASPAAAQLELPAEIALPRSRPAGVGTQRIVGASGGGCYLLVWADERNSATGPDIYGQLVTSDGQPVGDDFRICDAPGRQSEPTVAFNGQTFWVAWTDERIGPGVSEIFLARVSPDADVLPLQGFQAAPSVGPRYVPSLACSTSECLVTWSEFPDLLGWRLVGDRLGADGTVLEAAVTMSSDPRGKYYPGLAFLEDSSRFALFWMDGSRAPPVLDLAAQTLASDLTALGTPTRAELAALPAANQIQGPRTTSSPGMAWATYPVVSAGSESAIHLSAMDAQTLAILPPVEIARAPLGVANASPAFDGDVIWVALDRGVDATRRRVELTRVGVDGVIRDSSPAWVADNAGSTELPGLVSDDRGHLLLAYVAHDGASPYVAFRRVAWLESGGTCSESFACVSGSCWDGVCREFPDADPYRVGWACTAADGSVSAHAAWLLIACLGAGLRRARKVS